MKKYISTQEKLKTVKGEQNFIVSALYDENRKMIEASLSSPEEEGILGNLYIGSCSLETHAWNFKNNSASYT